MHCCDQGEAVRLVWNIAADVSQSWEEGRNPGACLPTSLHSRVAPNLLFTPDHCTWPLYTDNQWLKMGFKL